MLQAIELRAHPWSARSVLETLILICYISPPSKSLQFGNPPGRLLREETSVRQGPKLIVDAGLGTWRCAPRRGDRTVDANDFSHIGSGYQVGRFEFMML